MASAGGDNSNAGASGNGGRSGGGGGQQAGQAQQRIQFTFGLPPNIQPGQRVNIRVVPGQPGSGQQVRESRNSIHHVQLTVCLCL